MWQRRGQGVRGGLNTMRFFVVMVVAGAVAAYGPPRPSSGGDGGCGGGGGGGCGSPASSSQVVTSHASPCPGGSCGGTPGGSGQVTTHVSPCPGGNCGSNTGSSGSSSGDYWWQGQNNPFDSPQSQTGSHSCTGSGCGAGSSPCPGGGCPSHGQTAPGPVPGIITRPLPRPSPGLGPLPSPGSVQNLLTPPMGICPPKFVCVNWQLCRDGLVIDDGTGAIDKQRKVIPPRIANTYESCGGDMICCGIPEHSSFPGPGAPLQPPTQGTSFTLPATPGRPLTPVRPQTPSVSPPKFSGPASLSPNLPQLPVRPATPSTSYTEPDTPVRQPPQLSQPKLPGSGAPVSPSRPLSPPTFSGPDTPPRPARPVSPVSPPQFSGSVSPSRPDPQPSVASPSYGYPAPGTQQPAGASLLPSTVNQARPVAPSQPSGPVSSPLGLISPASGQPGGMGGMMGMGMMMGMAQSGSCSAGTYCVPQQQCNPYNGFIIRANTQVMAVWPDSPTVPLLPCFVPDGSITDGVCCQEAHPNAGGFD